MGLPGGPLGGLPGGPLGALLGGPDGGPPGGPDGAFVGGPLGGPLGGPDGLDKIGVESNESDSFSDFSGVAFSKADANGSEGESGGLLGPDTFIELASEKAPSSKFPSSPSLAFCRAISADVFSSLITTLVMSTQRELNMGCVTVGCLQPVWCRGYHAGLSFLRPGFNSRNGRQLNFVHILRSQ